MGPIPRPRGRAPNGKVWDSNIGEWVTESGPMSTRPKQISRPRGRVPNENVCGPEEKPRPRGRAPSGKVWDSHIGAWVTEPGPTPTRPTGGSSSPGFVDLVQGSVDLVQMIADANKRRENATRIWADAEDSATELMDNGIKIHPMFARHLS